MPFLLHFWILLFFFSCKVQMNSASLIDFQNKTVLTDLNQTANILDTNWPDDNITSFITASQLLNQNLNTSETTKMTTVTLKISPESTTTTNSRKQVPESTKMTTKMAPYNSTTKKAILLTSRYVRNYSTNTPASTACDCKDEKYKTAIMICAIIIAVLVLICAVLIICSVALANKVSSLKTKLTQSKRQARSNGDFLNASSILWSSGTETWQKKNQSANQTMDEILLGETITDEKHKLMTMPIIEKLKDPTEDKKTTTANDETMTIVSTVEV